MNKETIDLICREVQLELPELLRKYPTQKAGMRIYIPEKLQAVDPPPVSIKDPRSLIFYIEYDYAQGKTSCLVMEHDAVTGEQSPLPDGELKEALGEVIVPIIRAHSAKQPKR